MKSIEITGKRNIEGMSNIKNPQRKNVTSWNIDVSYFTYLKQIKLINSLYLEQSVEHTILVRREITKKIKGYKTQDILKTLFDKDKIISLEQVIERLMESKLNCFYCRDRCEVLYKEVLSKKQWTLDRINNTLGHNYDNVVVCCLECNVKRGNMDSERFKHGKEIKIVRKLF
jgi:5-methylcytosine-specific restriction endonuclease McrA